MAAVAFYISAHGYGHATRSAEVMRELARLRPDVGIHVRALAPPELFPECVVYGRSSTDAGVVEQADRLHMDMPATMERLRETVASCGRFLAEETEYVRRSGVALIVADIPFLAGLVAPELPRVALGNFTWHWLYEPAARGAHEDLLAFIRDCYRCFPAVLRAPFHPTEGWDEFGSIEDVPLIARAGTRSRAQCRAMLGAAPGQTAVLLGSRAAAPPEALARARAERPDILFAGPDAAGMEFPDLLTAADVVLSKLGYGIVAECIAARRRLLYPPRIDFREEALLQRDVPRFIPARLLPIADFLRGEWSGAIAELLAEPMPPDVPDCSGARVCAERIAAALPQRSG